MSMSDAVGRLIEGGKRKDIPRQHSHMMMGDTPSSSPIPTRIAAAISVAVRRIVDPLGAGPKFS